MNYAQQLIAKLRATRNRPEYSIETPAELYFVLGQFIIYVFSVLGGIDRFKREINHLTNPAIEQPLVKLGRRNLRFVEKSQSLLSALPEGIYFIQQALLNNQELIYAYGSEEQCKLAFYEGLYSNNMMEVFMEEQRNGR